MLNISIPIRSEITLKVYNVLGQMVRNVYSGNIEAGNFMFSWNGYNEFGEVLPAGMYFLRLTTNTNMAFTGKMIMLK